MPFTNTIWLDTRNRVVNRFGSPLAMHIVPASGWFRGTVFNPDTGKPFLFQGTLLQSYNLGAGYFLNSNLSGQVYLLPPAQ